MFSIRATVTGQAKILRALRGFARRAVAAVGDALYAEGQDWADTADKMTPEQEGNLRGSLFVSKPTAKRADVEVGYGAKHAARVHRRPRPATGTPQWLEVTMRKQIPGMVGRVGRAAKKNLESDGAASTSSARWPARPTNRKRRGSTSSGPRGKKG